MRDAKQAVIFVRVRHVGRDEQAIAEMQIARQRELCEAAAQRLNAVIVREYVEHGGTGYLERRPIVRQMLAELAQAHEADYVITASGDRLARRGVDFIAIDDAITAAGAELVFASDALSKSYNPADNKVRRDVRRVFAVLADQG